MAKQKKKSENVFHILARWFTRWFMGAKYEEKMRKKNASDENNKADDVEKILSPGRQILQRFFERKFAVFAVCVVIGMFLLVFIGPHFMPKYSDAYTEVTMKNLPPTLSLMKVPSELKNDIKMIDGYGSFTVGLSNSGQVYIWGVTQIGASDVDMSEIPEEVLNNKMAFVAAGIDHAVAIGEDGTFYAWGSDRFGQFGRSENTMTNPNIQPIPDEVYEGKLDVEHIKKVTCGYQATAILMDDGTLYIWGNKQSYNNMDKFVERTNITDVDFTLNNVVALDNKRMSIVTGSRGLYDYAKATVYGETEKMMTFLNGRKIQSICATATNICMLLEDGSIAFTGDFGQECVDVPTLDDGEYVIEVEAGNYHYSALTNTGRVFSFGEDHYYQATAPQDTSKIAKIYTGSFQNYAVDENNDYVTSWGLKGFIFGTDEAGASIGERVIAGGRITMTVGAVAVIIQIIIGVSVGCLAGYFGGWVDMFLMRIAEVFGSFPLIPFMMILSSLLAQKSMSTNMRLFMVMVILGVLSWPGFAWLTRAQILVARECEYVTAAQAMGVKSRRIAFKHILPNVISVILVNITLSFAGSMQTETSLSFLGFGVTYPQPSWGNMLTRASNATAAINFWWQWVFTSAILVLTTVCINTIGDTLRDVMDPKSSNDK